MELNLAKKIVLISSGQPSLNPRLVKEADALSEAGYEVIVLYAYWNEWGTKYDEQLIASKKWKAIRVGGHPEQKRFIYFLSKVIYHVAKTINYITNGKMLANVAVARAAYFLSREAKKHKAIIYIAHNLGALPAAVAAAKKNNKPCGFDAEDFHRNETSNNINNIDVIVKTRVENKYFLQVNYITTSSLQIANAYQQLFPGLKPVVLLNVFPKSAFKEITPNTTEAIKLFWFSQTIGPNRGINDIVKALQLLNKCDFELHLLGKQLTGTEAFISEIINSGITVKFHEPVHPDEVIHFATQFDIGLALEPAFSINNNLALSNKLFTYMQAGLAIIASDTTAQQDFVNKNSAIGYIYPKGNSQALATILLNYYQDRAQLTACKNKALQLAHQKYNWGIEGLKFLAVVNKTIATTRI